jgi:hypothetical protein
MNNPLSDFVEEHDEIRNSILPITGILLMLVSAFTPWFQSRIGDLDWKLNPMSVGALWPTSVLMILIAIGSAAKSRSSISAYGLYSVTLTIWGTFASWIWIFGSQVNHLLPFHHVPHGLIPGPRFGVYLGILTGLIGLLAGLFPNFANQLSFRRMIEILVSLLLAVLLIWSRDAPWIVVTAKEFQYRLSSDVIPVLGQLFAILCLITFVMLVIVNLTRHVAVKAVLLALSLFVSAYGLVAWIVNNELARMTRYVARSTSIAEQNIRLHSIGNGPKLLVLSGLLSAAFALYLLIDRHRDDLSPISVPANNSTSVDMTGIKFVE